MKSNLRLRPLAAAFLCASCISSCVLPPRQAWRVIQTEGLAPYIGIALGKRPIPAYARTSAATTTRAPSAPLPAMSLRDRLPHNLAPIGSGANWATTSYLRTGEPPRAPRSAAAPANPAPVAVVAPRAPVAPSPRVSAPSATLPVRTLPPVPKKEVAVAPPKPKAVETRPAPAKPSAPSVAQRKPVPNPALAAGSPDKGSVKPSPSAPRTVMPAPKPKVADAPPSTPSPAPKPSAPADEPPLPKEEAMPTGTWVPGRPGLVSSPFAAKHQLVDVNGIAPGETVKCPFSGKLFRVPAPSATVEPKPATPAR